MAASIESSSSSQNENKPKKKRGPGPISPDYTLKSACLEQSNISMDCMKRHNFKDTTSLCEKEFQNYKNCKAFWNKVEWRRFWRGDKPTLPLPEDREQAKKDYADIMEKVLAKSKIPSQKHSV